MPLTYEQAYEQTNPEASDEDRKKAALNIVAGSAANEAYWNSRSELEQLKAAATGHGEVVRGSDEEPTAVGSGTGTPPAIEGTAVEETPTGVPPTTGAESGAAATAPGTVPGGTEAPGDAATVARLRAQLEAANIVPEA